MESKYTMRWYQQGNWGIWEFPKHNIVLLWNDDKKEYEYYDMAAATINKNARQKAAIESLAARNRQIDNLRVITWGLAAALGVALGIIVTHIIINNLNVL